MSQAKTALQRWKVTCENNKCGYTYHISCFGEPQGLRCLICKGKKVGQVLDPDTKESKEEVK